MAFRSIFDILFVLIAINSVAAQIDKYVNEIILSKVDNHESLWFLNFFL